MSRDTQELEDTLVLLEANITKWFESADGSERESIAENEIVKFCKQVLDMEEIEK